MFVFAVVVPAAPVAGKKGIRWGENSIKKITPPEPLTTESGRRTKTKARTPAMLGATAPAASTAAALPVTASTASSALGGAKRRVGAAGRWV